MDSFVKNFAIDSLYWIIKLESLAKFSERDAEYYLSRIEKIEIGKPMGTHFMERTGIGGTKIELKIHKVIFRK